MVRNHNMSYLETRRIRHFFLSGSAMRSVKWEQRILEQLSPSHKNLLAERFWGEKVRRILYCQGVSERFLGQFVLKFKPRAYAQDERIEAPDCLVVLTSGVVSVNGHIKLKGSFIGADFVLPTALRRVWSALTLTFADALMCHETDFRELCLEASNKDFESIHRKVVKDTIE